MLTPGHDDSRREHPVRDPDGRRGPRAETSQPRRRPPRGGPREASRVYVVADLHLGRGDRDDTSAGAGGAFADFVDSFASEDREATLLVVAGDFVDLTTLDVEIPSGPFLGSARLRPQSREAAIERLEAIVAANVGAFAALGRFVASGGSLALVVGNHDVELGDVDVQRALLTSLARLGADAVGSPATGIEPRVTFHPWFLYRPKLLYVEHGHRLHDIAATSPGGADVALASARADLDADLDARLGSYPLVAQLEALARTPLAVSGRLGRLRAVIAVMRAAVGAVRRASNRGSPTSRRALSAAAVAAPWLPAPVLDELDGLRAHVGVGTLVRIARVASARPATILVPRLMPIAIAATLLAASGRGRAARVLGVAGSLLIAGLVVRHRRLLWPPPRSTAYLRDGADRIHATLEAAGLSVPVYVFGHSHVADVRRLSPVATYLNAGTWGTATDDAHGRADAAAHSYVRISVDAGRVVASLEGFVAGHGSV